MPGLTTIALATGVALTLLGALHRLVDTSSWPGWLDTLGAAAWYVVAFVSGVLVVQALSDDRQDADQTSDDLPDPTDDPTTAADELDESIDEATEDEQTATGSDLAEQLEDQTDPYVD